MIDTSSIHARASHNERHRQSSAPCRLTWTNCDADLNSVLLRKHDVGTAKCLDHGHAIRRQVCNYKRDDHKQNGSGSTWAIGQQQGLQISGIGQRADAQRRSHTGGFQERRREREGSIRGERALGTIRAYDALRIVDIRALGAWRAYCARHG